MRANASCAMPLFWKPYKSDATRLIEELKSKHPFLESEQRQSRLLFWDKPIDRAQQAEQRRAQVPQPAYVYQTKG
ncbi:MAG: DUF3460 family protein [Burkholderiales bacterium]